MCINTRKYIRDENSLNYHLTTVTSYECLRGWIQSRYYKTEISSSSFVKIEKAPVNIVIDYYGAKIQTNDNNLAYVLRAIKAANTI